MDSLSVLLPYVQIVLSVLLIGAILLQQSEGSLGSAFGGSQGGGASGWRTKRGLEKQLFVTTIVLAVLFALSAAIALFW